MKPKTSAIKLYAKPEEGKPFGEWKFVWLTSDEISQYMNKGFIRVKNLKKKGY
jgi:hypothetical protein